MRPPRLLALFCWPRTRKGSASKVSQWMRVGSGCGALCLRSRQPMIPGNHLQMVLYDDANAPRFFMTSNIRHTGVILSRFQKQASVLFVAMLLEKSCTPSPISRLLSHHKNAPLMQSFFLCLRPLTPHVHIMQVNIIPDLAEGRPHIFVRP